MNAPNYQFVTDTILPQDPLVKHKISPLHTAWADWLNNYDWTLWTTFTTRFELSLPSARRMAGNIARYCLDTNEQYMFWAAEEFDVRDGMHIHALIRTSVDKDRFWKWSFKRYGRALLLDYDRKLGAGHYVSKYISKRMTDYDWISGSTQRNLFLLPNQRILKTPVNNIIGTAVTSEAGQTSLKM